MPKATPHALLAPQAATAQGPPLLQKPWPGASLVKQQQMQGRSVPGAEGLHGMP